MARISLTCDCGKAIQAHEGLNVETLRSLKCRDCQDTLKVSPAGIKQVFIRGLTYHLTTSPEPRELHCFHQHLSARIPCFVHNHNGLPYRALCRFCALSWDETVDATSRTNGGGRLPDFEKIEYQEKIQGLFKKEDWLGMARLAKEWEVRKLERKMEKLLEKK